MKILTVVRGLLLREPSLDLLRVQDVGLRQIDDPAILDWAGTNDRIILTHDRASPISLTIVARASYARFVCSWR